MGADESVPADTPPAVVTGYNNNDTNNNQQSINNGNAAQHAITKNSVGNTIGGSGVGGGHHMVGQRQRGLNYSTGNNGPVGIGGGVRLPLSPLTSPTSSTASPSSLLVNRTLAATVSVGYRPEAAQPARAPRGLSGGTAASLTAASSLPHNNSHIHTSSHGHPHVGGGVAAPVTTLTNTRSHIISPINSTNTKHPLTSSIATSTTPTTPTTTPSKLSQIRPQHAADAPPLPRRPVAVDWMNGMNLSIGSFFSGLVC
jgi:hypothetical protein